MVILLAHDFNSAHRPVRVVADGHSYLAALMGKRGGMNTQQQRLLDARHVY